MKKYDILVIGGDAAGMSAASQARRTDNQLTIAVLEKGSHVSYAACGMPYFIADEVERSENLVAIDIDEFINKRRIEIFLRTEAVSINFSNKSALVRSPQGEEAISYGTLIIATGARPIVPAIKGIEAPNIFFLRSLAEGIDLKKYLSSSRPRTGIILGGGYIGLEMAEAFRKRSIETILLEKLESVAIQFSPDFRQMISATLLDNNVSVHTGVTISEISRSGSRLQVHTDSDDFEGDFILASTGISPNTGFLKNTGIRMNDRGAIIVDEKSRTSIRDVYAAGDCATARNLITGGDQYMPLGTTANKQGRVAGLQAAGVGDEVFPGIVGSMMTKVFNLQVGKTGLNEADSIRAGIPSKSASVLWDSAAGYYPSSRAIRVSLTMNKGTREVIGGEAAGTDKAALRTHVIAAAVTAKMKIEQLAYLDLGYAPPFSPVWDPVIAAAQKLSRL